MFKRTRDYAKDYRTTQQLVDGKVKRITVYTGNYYRLAASDSEVSHLKLLLALLAGAALLLYVAMALLKTGSMGAAGTPAFYVVIPYIFTLLPLGMTAGKTLMLILAKRDMTRGEYDRYVVMLKTYALMLAISAAVTFLCQLVYLALSGGGTADIAFTGLALALTAAAYAHWNRLKKHGGNTQV